MLDETFNWHMNKDDEYPNLMQEISECEHCAYLVEMIYTPPQCHTWPAR